MKFSYERFTKEDFNKMMNQEYQYIDGYYNGTIFVGDIAVDVTTRYHKHQKEIICELDFYVPHEDTGYGYKDDLPYDYAEWTEITNFENMTYEEFTKKAEEEIIRYIEENDKWNARYNNVVYSLEEHADRPIELW